MGGLGWVKTTGWDTNRPPRQLRRVEALNSGSAERASMKQLIIHGDPGIRKGAVIEYDDEEWVCFGINRNGDWHGPDRVQLWCTIGKADEEETFQTQEYIPMHLDTENVDAEAVTVLRERAEA